MAETRSSLAVLRRNWDSRDVLYGKGPGLGLSEDQILAIRLFRTREAIDAGAGDLMIQEARYWNPPAVHGFGRAR